LALTGVTDTRLLLTLEFPPTEEVRKEVEDLVEKEIGRRLLMPSVVLAEFIKIAGPRIGRDAAKLKMGLLKEKGIRVVALGEKEALTAGDMLLSHQNTPFADALIASFVKLGTADYVITDDPHFKGMGVRTKWIQLGESGVPQDS
jgi:predicted nucleic acid-binding protein